MLFSFVNAVFSTDLVLVALDEAELLDWAPYWLHRITRPQMRAFEKVAHVIVRFLCHTVCTFHKGAKEVINWLMGEQYIEIDIDFDVIFSHAMDFLETDIPLPKDYLSIAGIIPMEIDDSLMKIIEESFDIPTEVAI